MLTCYGHTCRLSRGDLTYLAFRLSLLDTIEELLLARALGEDPDGTGGFFGYVPILKQVLTGVQIDLLAEVWSRQRKTDLIEANLLDAAIVYAACENAARIIRDEPELAEMYFSNGPRNVRAKLTAGTPQALEALFDNFWDDIDFLSLSDFQDLDASRAAALKQFMRFPDDQPIYDALARGRVSTELAPNLEGLITPGEINEVVITVVSGYGR